MIPDGTTLKPDDSARIDPTILLPLTFSELELAPAVPALFGDNLAIDASLAPGRAAVATLAALTAIPAIAASHAGSGQSEPLAPLTPPPLPAPTPDPSD
ncbi:MAG: hypothetical protein NTX54_00110 [Chloroflexi bacterium]|nr:hypothetical protein [Chloroflexota bacterium]